MKTLQYTVLVVLIASAQSAQAASMRIYNESGDNIWVRVNSENPVVFKEISAKSDRPLDAGFGKKVAKLTIAKIKDETYTVNLKNLGTVVAPLSSVGVIAQVLCAGNDPRIQFENQFDASLKGKNGRREYPSSNNKFDPFDQTVSIKLPTLEMFEVYPNIVGVAVAEKIVYQGGTKLLHKDKPLTPGNIQTLKPDAT